MKKISNEIGSWETHHKFHHKSVQVDSWNLGNSVFIKFY